MVNNILNPKAQTPVETTTRVDPHIYEIGNAMFANAQQIASECDWLTSTIDTIAKAREDYEGGPFAVMYKVMDKMPNEKIEALPDPDADSGNNPGKFKVRTVNAKGKPVVKEYKYYYVLSDGLPCNIAKQARIDMLELSMKDPVYFNISSVPQDIKDMDVSRRNAEIGKLERALTTSRSNVLAAFELYFHIRKANDLPGVTVTVQYALGDDGQVLDGEDGRETVVDTGTKTPITITTTVKGREKKDTVDMSVGSFKKLRPGVAMEGGGTYTAFVNSAPKVLRGTKTTDEPGGAKPERIATLDTLLARLVDIHDYMDEVTSDTKGAVFGALLNMLNKKEGSADLLITITECRDFLTAALDKTYKAGERYQQYRVAKLEAEDAAAKSAA